MSFKRAVKHEAKLRLALTGPSGSGKTYSALAIATAMGGRIALIDTERGSASKYADIFEFDVCELESFHPQRYIDAVREAESNGYDIIIIDSLSHAWMGKDGALELVDRAAKASRSQNSYVAWRDVTPLQNALVDAMIGAKAHIITTLRTKTEYAQEKDDRGKTVIRKVGLAPVQRDGLEHEFDIFGELDYQNTLVVSKSRCSALQGVVIEKPGKEIAEILIAWLKGEAGPVAVDEKLAPPPAATAPPPRVTNGPSAQKRLGLAILAEGIDGQDFLTFLAECYSPGGLLPDAQGKLRLRDLPDLVACDALSRLPDLLIEYREWEQARSSPPVPPLQQEETSAEKLAKAEALAPRVTRRPEGGYSVPSQRDGHGSYLIREEAGGWTCQCDGYFYRAEKDPAYQCVHIMAARMAAAALAG